jgi:hypothetical protein
VKAVTLVLTTQEFGYLQRAVTRDLEDIYSDVEAGNTEEYVTAEHAVAERVRRLLRQAEQSQLYPQ